jgi:asparagine synthase (glutamine-hydrolysing)
MKYVLRKLGERYLPSTVISRKKQGFGFPLGLWFRSDLHPLIENLCQHSRLAQADIFRREEMLRLAREHIGGEIDHHMRLWMLFNLEIWYRHYMEGETIESLEAWIKVASSHTGCESAGRDGARKQRSRVPAECGLG